MSFSPILKLHIQINFLSTDYMGAISLSANMQCTVQKEEITADGSADATRTEATINCFPSIGNAYCIMQHIPNRSMLHNEGRPCKWRRRESRQFDFMAFYLQCNSLLSMHIGCTLCIYTICTHIVFPHADYVENYVILFVVDQSSGHSTLLICILHYYTMIPSM